MEKVIRNGKTAVLYQADFINGWYSENLKAKQWLVFHPDLIAAVEAGEKSKVADIAKRIGKEKHGPEDDTYTGAAVGLRIMWIETGRQFEITCDHGREYVHVIGDREYLTA